jgi:hypothetical protein
MNVCDHIRIAGAVAYGDRVFYPLVREHLFMHDSGSLVYEHPLALLMQEAGAWYFIALEDGVTPGILDNVIMPAREQ